MLLFAFSIVKLPPNTKFSKTLLLVFSAATPPNTTAFVELLFSFSVAFITALLTSFSFAATIADNLISLPSVWLFTTNSNSPPIIAPLITAVFLPTNKPKPWFAKTLTCPCDIKATLLIVPLFWFVKKPETALFANILSPAFTDSFRF